MSTKNIKKHTISIAAILSMALTGCGGGSSSGGSNGNGSVDPAPLVKLPALKSLSIPQTNFQTIKPSNFDIEPASNTALNTMAYENLQGDERIFEVAFQPCEQCDEAVMPTVTRVFDINQKYTMFNMNNSTVAWKGKAYHGNYPVIMDKQSGQLYPIVIDGKVSEFDAELQNESPFLSQQKQGDLIPNTTLYSFDITDDVHWHTQGIFKAVLENNAFVFKTLKSRARADERDIQIDAQGNILVNYQDPHTSTNHAINFNHYAYIKNSDEYQELDYQDTNSRYDSFRVVDGKLAGIDRAEPNYFSFVKPEGDKLVSTISQYDITSSIGNTVNTSKRSPQINSYDMNVGCVVNKLNENSYDYVGESALIERSRPYSSFDALRASQHTLFCVDYTESWVKEGVTVKVSAFDTETETFYDFDTGIELNKDFYAPDVDKLTAIDGAVVQSDQTVMLYMNRINSDEIVEFYINPILKTVEQRKNDGFISPTGFASISH
ncbi:hypothetical protein [Vibrio lentus]|uniref:Lipoprotein n=1 Tax=Vibrio lentus TaxID=136468 RepID=A0A2N7BMT8_9VIBR|nr:hypothetical protein [Vibrio lentus]PME55760.1 hypothetical protein BCV34_20185 [Vibrio lentus]PME59423.1 hypothetical protein BCV30_14500 [Vibrio lentus]PME79887.1 hypothetical protein BCV27_16535 [Vibrio lentus]PMH91159.1 hypothetical protein BCU56_14475 [Vibrio lentus]PMI03374.1 hypothetical protein BCU53_19030 [Vibrio lentus]